MKLKSIQLRDSMLGHLEAGTFAYFGVGDVVDYPTIGQIWVNVRVATTCVVRQVYSYKTGDNRIEFKTHETEPPRAFYEQLGALAQFWGMAVANHTVVEVIRRQVPAA